VSRAGLALAAEALGLLLLAGSGALAQTLTAEVDLAARIAAPVTVTPEVTWYRIDRDGVTIGAARLAYALRPDGAIEFQGEVEQAPGGVYQVQRSRWVFTRSLALLRFDEELLSGGERRALSGEVSEGTCRAVFEIPGAPPRALACAVPAGAVARYASGLALLAPENLRPGVTYRFLQLSPRSGRYVRVRARVLAGRPDGPTFILETTSDELPGLVVRTEVLPRSAAHPNGVTLRSEQIAAGLRIALEKVSEAEASEIVRAARDRTSAR
jgi:hypothetical protein